MELIDKNYLRLQFWNRVYKKTATEFQTFFEEIMQNAFSDFQKIKPYGNQGDGGNDGYRPSEGIYYQVYAPENPNEKEAKAAKKLKEDFEKLRTTWDQISKIKTFYFVFNDKGDGVSIEIEKALAELKTSYKNIDFKKFTPRDLEKTFFTLKKTDILALGFDVDSTNALRIAQDYLSQLEVSFDRENGKFVLNTLGDFKSILVTLQDEGLQLSAAILEARTLQKLEKAKEAKEKYENLCIRYPNDPQPFLYLAEHYLNKEDFEKNKELLIQAEAIDSSHWLLALEKLLREYVLGNQIDLNKIDEQAFPSDPPIKSKFYRLYSLFFERAGDQIRAESYIERAIHLCPEKIINYETKLFILGRRISQTEAREKLRTDLDAFLTEICAVEQKIIESAFNPRNQALINSMKLGVFRAQENLPAIEKLAKESFGLLIRCYFDRLIDHLLFEILMFVECPPKEFEALVTYLQEAEKEISEDLAKAMVLQFNHKRTLFTDGKKFFEATNKKLIWTFVENLENKKYDEAWMFLKEDSRFAVAIANTTKDLPALRKKIIESLPNDGNIQKEKLLILLNYDEKNLDEAFNLLKGLNLSNLRYSECGPLLEIAEKKKAWDFVVEILGKLLEFEKNKRAILQLRLQLFNANFNLERFKEATVVGEEILCDSSDLELLDDQNKEALLGKTVLARMRRSEYLDAKKLIEKYQNLSKTPKFKISVEAEVYLKNKDASKALTSVVEGIKVQKTPTPEQYGSLYFFFLEISHLVDFPLTSLEQVEANCFVKLSGQERWYFLGNDNELDATKVISSDEKYTNFVGKRLGEKIIFNVKYRSDRDEHTIENILPVEKYIYWQCIHHAQILTHEHRWDKMELIEVPKKGETLDTKYIIARLEDEKSKRGDFFDFYCKENVPLAFLAVNQGGLTHAFGCIMNENKGFIRFSSGNPTEINDQKSVAKKIIAGETFFMDATSALILSETGLLKEIYEYLPNLKVPQSVITFLLETKERFTYQPGQVGYMGYSQGKLTFSSIDQEKREELKSNFESCIKLLESKPENIASISNASKSEQFSEQRFPPELCDACILAQKTNVLVLTEDFLYLKVNEIETNKKAPEYCSAFAMISVLFEERKITFDQYLNFFTYLSSYRFRFLPLTTDDIEKAVFGDGPIKIVQPERIRQLNFPLTLSEEYGVPFKMAFQVVGSFLIKTLVDDTIPPHIVEKIFSEILSAFPTDKNKYTLGEEFLRECAQFINKSRKGLIVGTRVQEKFNLLFQSMELYGQINILWTPK